MEETTSRKIAQNCQDMPSRKNPKKEAKMPEVKENLKETVEDVKEKASEAVEDVKEKASEVVEEVKRSASNVVKAVKEEDTGARTMIVILALGCAAGSGFLAGKGGGAAPAALLGGEHPTPPTVSIFSQFRKIFQAWPSSAPAPGSATRRTRRSRCRPSAQLFNESYLCNSLSSHLDVNDLILNKLMCTQFLRSRRLSLFHPFGTR